VTGGRFPLLYPIDEEFFSSLGPQQAWLAGLFAADGCVLNDRLVTLNQSGEHGRRLIEQIQAMLGHQAPIHTRRRAHTITITSKAMVEFLARFNVVQRKTTLYRFPELLPADLTAPFLRGYIDGDGCVGVYDNGRGVKSLLISFFGTTEFVQRAADIAPVTMGVTISKRCPGMSEARAYGSKAIILGQWLWAHENVPRHIKQDIFESYISTAQTKYMRYEPLQHEALRLLATGMRPMQVARQIGLSCQTVWRWKVKCEARKPA